MRILAVALLGSSALFASSAMAQTGAATTNAAGSQQNQASLADCDRLITFLDKDKSDNAKVKPDTVRGWKRDNKVSACHDTLAQLDPSSAGTYNPNDKARITLQEGAPQIRVQQAQPTVTLHQMQPQITVHQPAPTVTVNIPRPRDHGPDAASGRRRIPGPAPAAGRAVPGPGRRERPAPGTGPAPDPVQPGAAEGQHRAAAGAAAGQGRADGPVRPGCPYRRSAPSLREGIRPHRLDRQHGVRARPRGMPCASSSSTTWMSTMPRARSSARSTAWS